MRVMLHVTICLLLSCVYHLLFLYCFQSSIERKIYQSVNFAMATQQSAYNGIKNDLPCQHSLKPAIHKAHTYHILKQYATNCIEEYRINLMVLYVINIKHLQLIPIVYSYVPTYSDVLEELQHNQKGYYTYYICCET